MILRLVVLTLLHYTVQYVTLLVSRGVACTVQYCVVHLLRARGAVELHGCVPVRLCAQFSDHEECNEDWLRDEQVGQIQKAVEEAEGGIGKQIEKALKSSRSRRMEEEGEGGEEEGGGGRGRLGGRHQWLGSTWIPSSKSGKKKKKNKGRRSNLGDTSCMGTALREREHGILPGQRELACLVPPSAVGSTNW